MVRVGKRALWGASLLVLCALPPMQGPALGADFSVTGISREIAGEKPSVLTVPSVEVIGGNLDEATIRTIFADGVAGSAEKLATLDAQSISIPTITMTTKDAPFPQMTMKDVALKGISGGVAQSVSVGGVEFSIKENESFSIGSVGADNVDIGRLLGLYGLVQIADRTTIAPVYDGLKVAGFSLKTPEISCTMGTIEFGTLSARPLDPATTATISRLSARPEKEREELPPEEAVPVAKMYVDLLTAFKIGPSSYGPLDCSGSDEGKPIVVKFGGITQDAPETGHTPTITYSGLDITSGESDKVQLGNFVMKPVGFAAVVDLIKAQGEKLTLEWLAANARKLVPSVDGFSIADVAIDIPDPAGGGTRNKIDFRGFDLSLDNYVNAVPATISATLDRLHVVLPPTPDNEPLIAMGYGDIVGDAAIALHWDREAETIVVDRISTKLDGAGAITVSGIMGNATADLFGDDVALAMRTGEALTLRSLTLELNDEGLLPKAVEMIAAEQGAPPDVFRAGIAAMAQGMVAIGLAGAPEGPGVSQAISDFINGVAPHLTVTATALDPAGLTMADFAAAEKDPTLLLKKVRVTASTAQPPAQDKPVDAGGKNPSRG